MAFQVTVKSGNVEEAKRIAGETTQKYGDRVIVSNVYVSKSAFLRSCRTYWIHPSPIELSVYSEYKTALDALRPELRKIIPAAKIVHRNQPIGEDHKKRLHYSAMVTLSVPPHEKEENIEACAKLITDLFDRFHFEYASSERQ
jgi:hypothetical protein